MKGSIIQKAINILYRRPRSAWKKVRRFGGYRNYRRVLAASASMQKESLGLPPIHSAENGYKIYFLTGKDYLYQTLFCIRSLVAHTDEAFSFVLVDDGTFDAPLESRIRRQLPGAIIVGKDQIEQNLENSLPARLYPELHRKRAVYPHIKKLTDIHTIAGEPWKLVLDSDMLFWSEPTEILEWLKAPDKPLHMVDCEESYGYSTALMENLSGGKIRPLVNVGAIGLDSQRIPWSALDNWVLQLEKIEGGSYYLEQALTAMLISGADSSALDKDKYIVNPVTSSSGVLHHYVDLSKERYFKYDWKAVI